MRTRITLIMLAICMSVAVTGCTAATTETDTAGQEAEKSPKVVLEEILASDTKTGTYDLTTEFADGEISNQTAEFWVDGDLFRIDYFLEDGTRRISILTDDGQTAYFARDEDETCEPAVATVQHYLDMFSTPEGELEDMGTEDGTGAQMLRYVVQQTEEVEGSANAWYTEDATYYVKGDSLLKVERRGAVPEDDGSIPDLQMSTMSFTSFVSGEQVDPTLFELPYPVQNAE